MEEKKDEETEKMMENQHKEKGQGRGLRGIKPLGQLLLLQVSVIEEHADLGQQRLMPAPHPLSHRSLLGTAAEISSPVTESHFKPLSLCPLCLRAFSRARELAPCRQL